MADYVTRVPLFGYEGDDRPWVIDLLRADGEPLDVTGVGWKATAQVRRYPDGPLLHEWTTAGTTPNARFIMLDPATEGSSPRYGVELQCDDSRTWTWLGLRAQYDLFLTDPEGNDQPVATGPVHWARAYTRPSV